MNQFSSYPPDRIFSIFTKILFSITGNTIGLRDPKILPFPEIETFHFPSNPNAVFKTPFYLLSTIFSTDIETIDDIIIDD